MSTPASASQENGTNVRSVFMPLAARLAPSLTARWAMERFCTPPRRPLTPRERAAIMTARPFAVEVGGRRLQAWIWGEGPAVLLAHGWGGRGAQLAAFAPSLIAAGRSVVTFDAPGHGASAGRRATLLDFRDALQGMAATVGPLSGIVAHSLGAAAATLALHEGLAVDRAVFLAPPADAVTYFRRFLGAVGLPSAVVPAMEAAFERRHRFQWRDLSVPHLAPALDTPLLVVHDGHDLEVPWEDGAAIAAAWPGAELAITTGLGHRKLVRDPAVVARVVTFLTGWSAPAASDFAPLDTLERELFDRDARWARVS
jgi:pimeloyl-ACP methyl ester carboxylesterase